MSSVAVVRDHEQRRASNPHPSSMNAPGAAARSSLMTAFYMLSEHLVEILEEETMPSFGIETTTSVSFSHGSVLHEDTVHHLLSCWLIALRPNDHLFIQDCGILRILRRLMSTGPPGEDERLSSSAQVIGGGGSTGVAEPTQIRERASFPYNSDGDSCRVVDDQKRTVTDVSTVFLVDNISRRCPLCRAR